MNYFGGEIVAVAANREVRVVERLAGRVVRNDRLDTRDGSKTLRGIWIVGGEDDASFGAVPVHQTCRAVDVNDASVFDDRDPVTQSLGLLHQMSGQENGLAAVADAAHEIPDGPPRLWIQAGGQLVEKHEFGIV